MIGCEVDFATHIIQILENSGRYLYHKGHYQECLSYSDMKYSMIELGVGDMDAGAFIGVCLPRGCSDDMIKNGANIALQKLGLPYNIFSIDSHSDTYHIETDWLTYLTLTIIALLIVVTLVSSLLAKKHSIIQAFDVRKNMAYFKIRKNEDLNIFDGVRAISMMWVVIGHIYSFFLSAGVINIDDIEVPTKRPSFLIIEAGLVSVDIFFMLGGFFLAFVFLRQKTESLSIYPLGILQRALRIWPAYLLAIIFYYSVFMQIGSGPLWSKIYPDVQMCSTMWRSLLFIENIVDNGQVLCLGWSWYLQVDFQLFLASLFLLFVYNRSKILSYLMSIACCIGSLAFNFIYTFNNGVMIFTDLAAFATFGDFMLYVYIKPWGRCVPYLMGLMLGQLYMDYRNNRNNNWPTALKSVKRIFQQRRMVRIFIEWLGIGLMALVTFIPRDLQLGNTWPQYAHSLYWMLSKPIFILGLIFTILPSILGCTSSFFNLILTPKIFHFIARISFCTYLVHLMIIYQFIFTRTNDIYYSLIDVFVLYLGILIISLFFGFIMTMLVQLPFANLQRDLMKKMQLGAGDLQRKKEMKQILIDLRNDEIEKKDKLIMNKSSTDAIGQ